MNCYKYPFLEGLFEHKNITRVSRSDGLAI
jgi:hypothetical protein